MNTRITRSRTGKQEFIAGVLEELPLQLGVAPFGLVFGILGGALSQVPAGWIADRYDRRYVLISFSIFAFFSCIMISLINTKCLRIKFLNT